jgi:hypothetical protein
MSPWSSPWPLPRATQKFKELAEFRWRLWVWVGIHIPYGPKRDDLSFTNMIYVSFPRKVHPIPVMWVDGGPTCCNNLVVPVLAHHVRFGNMNIQTNMIHNDIYIYTHKISNFSFIHTYIYIYTSCHRDFYFYWQIIGIRQQIPELKPTNRVYVLCYVRLSQSSWQITVVL